MMKIEKKWNFKFHCNNKLQRRVFKSQAYHFIDDNDWSKTQADIQSQAQSQSSEYIKDQGRLYAQYERENLSNEHSRLNRIDRDIMRINEEANDRRTAATDQLNNIAQSLLISQESQNELDSLIQRYNTLDQSTWERLRSLDANQGQESITYQYVVRGLNELAVNRSKKIIDIFLGDNSVNDEQRSRLNNLKQEFQECKSQDVRASEYRVELARNWADVDEQIEKLRSNYPDSERSDSVSERSDSASERRSNVSDFADPSTEMPSYIDPED